MIRREDIEGSQYAYIYDKGLPDKDLEFYWYGFSNSIKNTITSPKLHIPPDILKLTLSKLESTRNILNQLQTEEKYDMILNTIEEFIVWIGRHIMINYGDPYNYAIYITNVKRWGRWILKEKEGSKLSFEWMNKNNSDHFTIFFELKTHLIAKSKCKNNECPVEIKLLGLVNNYNPGKASHNLSLLHEIMEYLIQSDYLKPTLLESLDAVCPVIDYLKNQKKIPGDLKICKPYSFEKILKKHLLKK
jgi:hypothetical protein